MNAPDLVTVRRIQRDFQELAKPFVTMKCDILAVVIPIYVRNPNGLWSTTYDPETLRLLGEVDILWQKVRNDFLERHRDILENLG